MTAGSCARPALNVIGLYCGEAGQKIIADAPAAEALTSWIS
jgi:hypothetical protein